MKQYTKQLLVVTLSALAIALTLLAPSVADVLADDGEPPVVKPPASVESEQEADAAPYATLCDGYQLDTTATQVQQASRALACALLQYADSPSTETEITVVARIFALFVAWEAEKAQVDGE